jgi:hypothetical protein
VAPARTTVAVALPALALLACGGTPAGSAGGGGGGSPSPSPSVPAVHCASLPAAIGPDVAGSLAQTDSGGTFCVHVGKRVSVFLSVPIDQADSGRWAAITASDGTVLQAVPNGALTLVRGVTAGIFAAGRVGTSRLSSTRPPCTAAVAAGCPAGMGWQVTIVVEG